MYTRETEIRHLLPNDVYKLGVILDDNNCWKKLMEIIPKYKPDHIRLIEDATKRPGESRLYSQIFFDEWGTSGRKAERPTVGVLLQLLTQAELFRAADFVAINFLNEPPPPRPLNGPAAKIDISLTNEIFDDIEDLVNDSAYYPGTATLHENANYRNSLSDNNKDFYSKYHNMDKHVNVNDNALPKPPPRTRSTRLQLEQRQNDATTAEAVTNGHNEQNQVSKTGDIYSNDSDIASQNIPKFSELLAQTEQSETMQSQHTESTVLSQSSSSSQMNVSSSKDHNTTEGINGGTENRFLPVISGLYINGEHINSRNMQHDPDDVAAMSARRSSNTSSSSMSNDSFDDEHLHLPNNEISRDIVENDEYEDNSVPNLSIFDQRSSNNDSSLTTVTGTSEESSIELSMNDLSSASNDENIPCLSALK